MIVCESVDEFDVGSLNGAHARCGPSEAGEHEGYLVLSGRQIEEEAVARGAVVIIIGKFGAGLDCRKLVAVE